MVEGCSKDQRFLLITHGFKHLVSHGMGRGIHRSLCAKLGLSKDVVFLQLLLLWGTGDHCGVRTKFPDSRV